MKAKWDGILERGTWERLVAKRKIREPYGPKAKHLLSPWVICGRCGQPLGGSVRRYKKGEKRYETRIYRCNAMPEGKARGSCGKLSVSAEPVENLTLAWIFRRITASRGFTATINNDAELHRQLDQAGADLEVCESELEELHLAREDKSNRISLSEYLRLKKPIIERQDEIKALIKSLTQKVAIPHPVGRDYGDLRAWFDNLSLNQQQKLVGAHVRAARILPTGRAGGRFFNPERVMLSFTDEEEIDG